MAKKRSFLTIIVFAGYILLAALAGLAVWFTYEQVAGYNQMTERNSAGNQKLLLVGEAATKLYEAESLSRQLIQSQNQEGLETYNEKIDSIKMTLASLQNFRADSLLDQEIDSINILLSQKTQNLKELLTLRAQGETDSYYSRVLTELQRVDETFEDPNYAQRFRDLEPHQRRVLVKLLEYAKLENPEPTNLTVDSLVTSVKRVLAELERQERQYREVLRTKESELLTNEMKLNNRLRTLLSAIEAEERRSSLQQVSTWQQTVEDTSRTIGIIGVVSLLVILTSIFLVVRDVSRSQRYRKELEGAKSYAETLLKSREQFMNTVTHDLRSPLTTVIGYAGLLEKTGLNKTQNRYLDQLRKASDYILHLVNDLLDFSKLEAGKMSIERLPFNAKNLIEETVENAIPPTKPKEVEVRITIDEALDRPVITDPFRIKQILINLVSNACKFTSRGSVEVNAQLVTQEKESVLSIQVKDTGIGISKEQKEKVFEEFSQEDSSIEKRFGGSGLGLAISKKLTELLGGTIQLESEPGQGSTFFLLLPIAFPEDKNIPASTEKLLTRTPLDLEVLLVDDEPSQLSLLKELVKNQGMTCHLATNGKEALEILRKKQPDMVLTDIQMPELDGFGLLKQMKQDSSLKNVPIIALSGQPNTSPEEYMEKGFSGSLLKPYSSIKLLELIGRVLQVEFQKRQEQPIPAERTELYTLSEIKNFAGEDGDALRSILDSFIESTRKNLELLQHSCQEGDYQKVSAVAHKMLPMFRQLGTQNLIAQLEILERANPKEISSCDFRGLRENIEELLEQLEQEATA